jgi:hypothetical protein
VLTKVRFLDKDDQVLPEMSAKVAFLTEQMSEAEVHEKPKILVDPAAVVDRGNSKVVFLVQGQQVVQKPVKTSQMVGSSIEVTEGLSPGDQVVLNPAPDLQSGEKIKIQS